MSPIVDPALTDPQTVLGALDFAGVAVFAATGALAAAQQRHDLVTFAFFGAITGVGGGTLRDLLIGAPVFWVQDWRYIAVCLLASLAVWMVGARPWRFRALLWLDAIGLAAYGVMGAAKAEAFQVAPLICIVMGALTACFGGVVRDLLAGREGVRIVGDRFVFSSEVLFQPGAADLAPEGQAQIAGVAETLSEIADKIPPGIDWIIRARIWSSRAKRRSRT